MMSNPRTGGPGFEGTFTALVTPFKSDGSVDFDALSAFLEWQIESGIDGVIPCGTTGESATLTSDEHVAIVRHVVDVVGGRVPVVAGTGSNSTREAVALTQHARDAGADGALMISPYYNRPTQDGIFHHYRTVGEEVGLPMVVYNVPGRTGSRVEPETLARLSRLSAVAGTKDAGADLGKTSETIAAAAPGFSLLSGDDALTLPMLALGAKGVVSTTSNVAPAEMAQITRAYRSGDLEGARKAHYALLDVMKVLFVESNPIPVKTALHLLGRIPDATLRLPLTPMQKENRDRLEAALSGLTRA
jgi:4-hydroxy-tetrahydrodipicolinate synthase